MAGASVAERLVNHKHCPVCGKAMSVDKETCSDECSNQRRIKQQERKRTLYFFYAAIIIMAIVMGLQIMAIF
jgi:predicted nucleic acid-binding Zn ribbon protein